MMTFYLLLRHLRAQVLTRFPLALAASHYIQHLVLGCNNPESRLQILHPFRLLQHSSVICMRLRKLARYVSSWLNLGMDGTSFPLFPLLPAELQFNIWDQSIGPPRIHIFRPAPLDGAHWFQDYACPIHQYVFLRLVFPVSLRFLLPHALTCPSRPQPKSLTMNRISATINYF